MFSAGPPPESGNCSFVGPTGPHTRRSAANGGAAEGIAGEREDNTGANGPRWGLGSSVAVGVSPTVGPGEMERVGGTPKQRRIIAAPGTGDGMLSDAAATSAAIGGGAELTAPASTAVGGKLETLAASSSPYSAVASPIRHRRDNPTPAREPAGGATTAAAAGAVNGRLSPPTSPRTSPTDAASYGRDDPKYRHLNTNGSSSISSGYTSGLQPGTRASEILTRRLDVLERRANRMIWVSRWRTSAARCRARFENRLSRLLRHRWGRRLVGTSAVFLVGFSWFLLITAVVGPAGGSGGSGGGGVTAGGEKDGAGAAQSTPSYYRKIAGDNGVGPSLSDPWVVRDIEIAAADWGVSGGAPSQDDEEGGSRAAEGEAAALVVGGGAAAGVGKGWDGRVNTIVTGELKPAGEAKTRPKVDLLLVIFSGTSEPNIEKRELLRQIYDKYEGWVKVGGPNSITGGVNPEKREFTFSVIFVMSKETAPPEGELVGDILYVPVPEGYRNIVLKTRAMLCLVRHFDFQFLLKADDDSFVCVARIASMLHDLDPEIAGKIYAGVPTACNQDTNPDYWNGRVMKNPDHRWFDSKFVQHTLGGLDCFPAYMQGAFYILAYPLVEHLYRGHEHLECFTNEDVTIGSWLMGVDREIVEMYNLLTSHLWDCLCARNQITARTRRKQMFFHNCKGLSQLKLCGSRLLRPGIGC